MDQHVQFDRNGYIIDGTPEFLSTGEFQYFRLTRGEWRKRLLQMKLAGFNAVSAYFAWNYHEVSEGSWDFSGDKDCEEFLKICAELGVYVIARPGPFICNEWENGGIPAWLAMRKDIRLRTADPQYLSYCDKWFDQIVPILARYQLGCGGMVIAVQVENEYGHAGEHQEADYIYHLRDGFRARGVTVPLINCDSFIVFDRIKPHKWKGINLCCNAGGDGLRVMQRARALQPDAPLYVTEFWIAAFDWWGRDGSAYWDDAGSVYGALEMIAGGAGGLTVFVFSGGSNFGYWHGRSITSDNNFIATGYGPGAPILDDGSFCGKYYLFKRAFSGLYAAREQLARAEMPEITGDMNGLCKAVRRSGDTVFTFFINHSKEQMAIADAQKEQGAVDFSIPAGVVRWSVENLPLKSGYTLLNTSGQLFAANPALVVFAPAGEEAAIRLRSPLTGKEIVLEAMPSEAGEPVVWSLNEDGKPLTVILLSETAVDDCYRLELPGASPVIVGGIHRIDNVTVKDGEIRVEGFDESKHAWKADEKGYAPWNLAQSEQASVRELPINGWEKSDFFAEAQPDYDDSRWYAAEQPQPMQRFGTGNGWVWYRTWLDVSVSGFQLIFPSGAADHWLYFVDGEFKTARGAHTHNGENLMVWLEKGRHQLTILCENLGMYNTGYEMDIPMGEPKGIFGPVWMNGNEIHGWKMRGGLREEAVNDTENELKGIRWEATDSTKLQAPGFVKGSFALPPDFTGALRVELARAGKGSVWINGFNIGRYWNVGPVTSLWIPADKLREQNELVLFEQREAEIDKVKLILRPFGKPCSGVIKLHDA